MSTAWRTAVLTVAAVTLLAGCATSSGGDAAVQPDAAMGVAAVEQVQPGAPALSEVAGTVGVSRDAAVPAAGPVAEVDRKMIVTANTTVEVPDVAAAARSLAAAVTAAGGSITSENTYTGAPIRCETLPMPVDALQGMSSVLPCQSSSVAWSVTTVSVPPAAVDRVLGAAAALGTQVTVQRSASDVTAQVADVQTRLANAQASVARIRSLLTEAQSLQDVVLLESELSRREADLESWQAQQRALAQQTDKATVTVELREPAPQAATPGSDEGFLAGLQRGWEAFTGALVVGMTVLGALVPFAGLLALAGAVIAVVRRRRRLRREPSAQPAAK